MKQPLPGEFWQASSGEYAVQRFLGKGKSGYSYLALRDGQQVVLKVMHDEDIPYYAFHDSKVTLEVQAYARLAELGVRVPTLMDHSVEGNYLIKTFVPGEVVTQAIAQDQVTSADVAQMLSLSRGLQQRGLNIDWFPTNFVLDPGGPVYVDYEINPYHQQWSFEHWGVWYWANVRGMHAYLQDGDILHLNADLTSGTPRQDAEVRQRVTAWLAAAAE